MAEKVRIVCAMHRLAQEWARRSSIPEGTFITVTSARGLRGLPVNTEVIVIDTACKFEDIHALNEALKQFTTVTRTRL